MRLRPRQNQIRRRHDLIYIRRTLGEVTTDIAEAIPAARATKVLLPINRARLEIAGSEDQTLDRLITRSLTRGNVVGGCAHRT